jgi:lysophospholipase L1-like esterase
VAASEGVTTAAIASNGSIVPTATSASTTAATTTTTATATATATTTATPTPTATTTSTSTSTSTSTPATATRLPSIGYLEAASNLGRLFASLAALDDGQAHDDVRILQYGDSHTASDMGTSAFRRVLQARFGDGGRGFVSLGLPWKNYYQDGVRSGMTSTFEVARSHARESDGCYGLLGVGVGSVASGARAWTALSQPASRVEIDYWQDPRAGSFDVIVDGTRTGRVSARAVQAGSGFYAVGVPDARHEVEVRAVGDGPVRVFGMALDRDGVGVTVDSLGINGAQVFTALRWSEDHFAEQLRHRAPQLVVLAYGTNESLDATLSDAAYERGLVDLLGRLARATPAASCLLLGPPDAGRRVGSDWVTSKRVQQIAAIQRRVAQAAGCAFFDQAAAMGGPGSILAWAVEPEPRAQRDRIHLTRSGYTQLGTAFANDLVRAYGEWRAAQGMPPAVASRVASLASR